MINKTLCRSYGDYFLVSTKNKYFILKRTMGFIKSQKTLVEYPLTVTIKVTAKCNLNCIHCHGVMSNGKELSLKSLKNLISELSKVGVLGINLSGGEPFLRKDIFDIIQLIEKTGIRVTMSTNATLISEEIAKKMKEKGIDYCQVSMDSYKKDKHDAIRGCSGSFSKMILGVKNLKQAGIKVKAVTVLSNQTPTEYEKTIDFAYKTGFDSHKTNPLIPCGQAKTIFDEKYKTKITGEYFSIWTKKRKQYTNKMLIEAEPSLLMMMGKNELNEQKKNNPLFIGCPAGTKTCSITETGEVIPCPFFTELSCGNIMTEKFSRIWNSSKILRKIRDRNYLGKCDGCKYIQVCGGCRARAYNKNQILIDSDDYCFNSNLQKGD